MAPEDDELIEDPLFVGLTRPATIGGVPYFAFVFNMMVTSIAFLGAGNIFVMVIGLPLHGVLYAISADDPNRFYKMWIWVNTIGKCRNRKFWNAASFSPLTRKKWIE